MARNVTNAALTLDATRGLDARDPPSMDPPATPSSRLRSRRRRRDGSATRARRWRRGFRYLADAHEVFGVLRARSFAANLHDLYQTRRAALKPEIVWNVERGPARPRHSRAKFVRDAEMSRSGLIGRGKSGPGGASGREVPSAEPAVRRVFMSEKSLVAGPEWPTLALIAAVYATWIGVTIHASALTPWIATPVLALALTLHSSLQHEVIHGHPLRSRRLSAALVYPPLGLAIPYPRFRDQHLAHHRDVDLTDPYDDPESNYLDPAVWERLPEWARRVLLFNNTLLGRITVGPAVGMAVFLRDEARAAWAGDQAVRRAWVMHAAALVPLGLRLAHVGTMPVWAYLLSAYAALSILKIRTFLEHQAHERAIGRTVIIEDRGPLAFLFLNNNLHAVHHAHPQVPWYRLPALYAERRAEYLQRNLGYRYAGYGEVLARHFLRRKDPVPHPHWRAE